MYEDSGLRHGWTAAQVDRLCALFKVTRIELGEMFLIHAEDMYRWYNQNHFPPYVSLHFVKALTAYDSCVLGLEVPPDDSDLVLAQIIRRSRG